MKLNADLIESFSGIYLSNRYDAPKPTPEFHREVWGIYCNPEIERAAVAAPRRHAKTTALTFDFGLAAALFRWQEFILILGSTEDLAKINLRNMVDEIKMNEALRLATGVRGFIIDQQTDVIVECLDGYQFRIMARGVGQAIRGLLWHGKRPGLILGDDLEDDEMVANRDRRIEFKRWFYEAVLPCLRMDGVIRVHGTIMHDDAFLAHLMKDSSWVSRKYSAHKSYDEFTDILWPEVFSEPKLRAMRTTYETAGRSDSYSKEWLNDPRDTSEAYLRKEQFLPMADEDYELWKMHAVGVDLAISTADHANRTSFTVVGKDLANSFYVVDERVGRWTALDIIEEFFLVDTAWKKPVFFVEGGVIWRGLEPFLNAEMHKRNQWLTLVVMNPIKDKAIRGRSLQARMKARLVKFDKRASWYLGYEDELLHFTGYSEALLDDQFDSTAIVIRGLEGYQLENGDERTEEEDDFLAQAMMIRNTEGRSSVTGY